MKEFKDKVAVVTGAASGIGRALAGRCLKEGMKVVLADVESGALAETRQEIARPGYEVLPVETDVSKTEEVEALAQKTVDTFGEVHLLFNNAGVAAGAALWESTLNDCRWVMGVNLWGVIHCVRAFVPIMLAQDSDCHIVNTSSIGGLNTYHPSALYQLTKHGIVALSEQLHHDLALRGTKIRVSVLCPGFVCTRIMDAERNRPEIYRNEPAKIVEDPKTGDENQAFRQMVQNGMSPETVANYVFTAITEEKFYIFTHPELNFLIKARMEGLASGRNPELPPMQRKG